MSFKVIADVIVESSTCGVIFATVSRIVKVVFDIADDAYVDVQRYFAAAMSRD